MRSLITAEKEVQAGRETGEEWRDAEERLENLKEEVSNLADSLWGLYIALLPEDRFFDT